MYQFAFNHRIDAGARHSGHVVFSQIPLWSTHQNNQQRCQYTSNNQKKIEYGKRLRDHCVVLPHKIFWCVLTTSGHVVISTILFFGVVSCVFISVIHQCALLCSYVLISYVLICLYSRINARLRYVGI